MQIEEEPVVSSLKFVVLIHSQEGMPIPYSLGHALILHERSHSPVSKSGSYPTILLTVNGIWGGGSTPPVARFFREKYRHCICI